LHEFVSLHGDHDTARVSAGGQPVEQNLLDIDVQVYRVDQLVRVRLTHSHDLYPRATRAGPTSRRDLRTTT
jgi:hypothetical protein